MAKEVHYILFTREEVGAAVRNLLMTRGIRIEYGGIGRVTLTAEAESVGAMASAFARGQAEPKEIALRAPDLLAAMILYCHDRRIPLASRAYKRLELSGEELALVLRIDFDQIQPAVEGETVSYADRNAVKRALDLG